MSFEKICTDIKNLRIQGATNAALAALDALQYKNNAAAVKKLLSLRQTEPLLQNAVRYAAKNPRQNIPKARAHILLSRVIIAQHAAKLVRKHMYTHCHSSSVIEAFKIAKKTKKFDVHCTETRPLFQGRRTARDCRTLKLETHFYTDNNMRSAIMNTDAIFLGADALTQHGVINKIGSSMAAHLAREAKKPVYILADSWKYINRSGIEERASSEVWIAAPKGIHIHNPAFDVIPYQHITGIITELGILSHQQLLTAIRRNYPELAVGKKR